MESRPKRQIAYKVRIRDILDNEFFKGEGWDPSYISTPNNIQISRANIIGIVIDKSDQENTCVLDDSANQIVCRLFEKSPEFELINIGDTVSVIGRPRAFGDDKYIIPEIIKKIDTKWFLFRKKELETFFNYGKPPERPKVSEETIHPIKEDSNMLPESSDQKIEEKQKVEEETIEEGPDTEQSVAVNTEEEKQVAQTPAKIIELIKELDSGNGVDQDLVITEANIENGDKVIALLLQEGEIFEISPGKLKVLE